MRAALVHHEDYDSILINSECKQVMSVDFDILTAFIGESYGFFGWDSQDSWDDFGDTIEKAVPQFGELVAYYNDDFELIVVNPTLWVERRSSLKEGERI